MLSPPLRDSALLLSFGSRSRARHEIQVTPNSPRAAVPLAIQDSHLGKAGELTFARKSETKCRAFAEFGFDPNPAAVALDNRAADCEPETAAGNLIGRVQPLKQSENLCLISRVDAHSVVANPDDPFLALLHAGD